MSASVQFEPEAQQELAAASVWYEGKREGLGHRFLEAVRRTLDLACESPMSWPAVPGVDRELGARRIPVKGFPYALVFLVLPGELRVLAVAHAKRRPGYWRDRGAP